MKFQITIFHVQDACFLSVVIEADDIVDCMMKYYDTDDEDLEEELRDALETNTNQGLTINEHGGWISMAEEAPILLIVEV